MFMMIWIQFFWAKVARIRGEVPGRISFAVGFPHTPELAWGITVIDDALVVSKEVIIRLLFLMALFG